MEHLRHCIGLAVGLAAAVVDLAPAAAAADLAAAHVQRWVPNPAGAAAAAGGGAVAGGGCC